MSQSFDLTMRLGENYIEGKATSRVISMFIQLFELSSNVVLALTLSVVETVAV